MQVFILFFNDKNFNFILNKTPFPYFVVNCFHDFDDIYCSKSLEWFLFIFCAYDIEYKI